MATYKTKTVCKTMEVEVEADVEIEIEFEDVIKYLDNEGLTPKQSRVLNEVLNSHHIDAKCIHVRTYTIMDEVALPELTSLINKHGLESILAMVKAGQGVAV